MLFGAFLIFDKLVSKRWLDVPQTSLYRVNILPSFSNQGHFGLQLQIAKLGLVTATNNYMAVRHNPNLFLSGKWPIVKATGPLFFFLVFFFFCLFSFVFIFIFIFLILKIFFVYVNMRPYKCEFPNTTPAIAILILFQLKLVKVPNDSPHKGYAEIKVCLNCFRV